jgi:hypothetical protein
MLPIQKKLANKRSDGKVDIEETDEEEKLELRQLDGFN